MRRFGRGTSGNGIGGAGVGRGRGFGSFGGRGAFGGRGGVRTGSFRGIGAGRGEGFGDFGCPGMQRGRGSVRNFGILPSVRSGPEHEGFQRRGEGTAFEPCGGRGGGRRVVAREGGGQIAGGERFRGFLVAALKHGFGHVAFGHAARRPGLVQRFFHERRRVVKRVPGRSVDAVFLRRTFGFKRSVNVADIRNMLAHGKTSCGNGRRGRIRKASDAGPECCGERRLSTGAGTLRQNDSPDGSGPEERQEENAFLRTRPGRGLSHATAS